MSLSHNTNNDGSMKITTNILIIAPRAISVQSEPIISTEAIHPTPNVAAKKPSALTIIDGIDVERAISCCHKNSIIDCCTKLDSTDNY